MARFRSRSAYQLKYPYPRRQFIRGLLRGGIRFASSLLLKYKVEGLENLPEQGPLLLVGNHFHFLDTISPIHTTPYALEFIGDAVMPNAPGYLRFFPSLWGTLQILQGTPNLEAMRAAEAVLSQKGVLAIFPEGHVHKPPLGKPLPGASYLALRSGAPIVPIATFSEDNWDILGTLRRERRRARVIARIGKAFGPLSAGTDEVPGRTEIRAAGEEIIQHIARLLPPQAGGTYGLPDVAGV